MIDYKALREAAEKAVPVYESLGAGNIVGAGRGSAIETFINSFTPATILALLDEIERVRNAAGALFELLYRDENVTDRGRPKSGEIAMAYQKLGEALGRFGGPLMEKPNV